MSDVKWLPLILALCLVPLFLTPVLPLIDFYAHIARFYILSHLDQPALAENYSPAWRLLPNLGLDVLGTAVMGQMTPLLGAKLLAAIIILAPFLGTIALAKAVQGRVGLANLALAGILSYSFILSWGFANFVLGLGLALGALGMWIALAAAPGLQLITGVLAGVVIMLVHGLVFGLWGLLLFSVEVAAFYHARFPSMADLVRRILRLLILAALPAVLFLQSRTSGAEGGVTGAFTNLAAHAERGNLQERLLDEAWQRIDSFLRVAESTFPMADRAFGALLWATLAIGLLIGALRLDKRLILAALLAFILIGITPPNLFGVGHLDERMPLLLLALLAAGCSTINGAILGRALAALFVLHMGMVSYGWFREGQSYRAFLKATDGIKSEGLATAAFYDPEDDRDESRSCKPLLFLLLLQKGIPVPTFANPTQQPLEIRGPLAVAISAMPEGNDLPAIVKAGFGTIVTCSQPQAGTSDGLVAADGKWALYQPLQPVP
jgi:hypothetical protein